MTRKILLITGGLLLSGSAQACDLWPSPKNGGETWQQCMDRKKATNATNYDNSYPREEKRRHWSDR